MADKSWIVYLSEGARILVFLHTKGRRVTGFAVVLVALIHDEPTCVTRYDTAHGQPHRDVLGRKEGLLEKQWLLDLTFNEAFQYALSDFGSNYASYIKVYLEN